jgi:cytochrome c
MDSFEMNKILGALLGTCLVLLAVHIASGAIFSPRVPAKPGYVIEVKTEQAAPSGGAGAAKPAVAPIDGLLAGASTQHGAQVARECELCHNLGKGGAAKIGPPLYGVVGRKVAPSLASTTPRRSRPRGALGPSTRSTPGWPIRAPTFPVL